MDEYEEQNQQEMDEAIDNVDLKDSNFFKKDMYTYFGRIITPDMQAEEKISRPDQVVPLFTKDMKISNIDSDREFNVFTHAVHHLNFIQFLKSKICRDADERKKNYLSSEDRLKLIMNYKLNLYSSKNGFERKIQHSKIITSKQSQTIKDEARKSGWFGKMAQKEE